MSAINVARYWINQPSALQELHALHGQNVLAHPEPNAPTWFRVYPLSGDVISFVVHTSALSPGWRP